MFHFKRKSDISGKSNILFVCKCIPWRCEEGIDPDTWDISRHLVEKGHDVTILCVGSETGCENSHIKEGIVITEIPYLLGSYIESISKLAANYFFNAAVKKWVNENVETFDIVHTQGENGHLFVDDASSEPLIMKMQG
ncbi:hypothetical protein [Reichenbachiella sp. MALMAid0571]|uniref:hypothetical protein n=1 Tax=Reichenbachiella sp. MALMAid0571 TaxID=3143939 RepID=UPI0032DEE499